MWTDNASDIDLLFYKPYADIISEDAVSLGKDPLTILYKEKISTNGRLQI